MRHPYVWLQVVLGLLGTPGCAALFARAETPPAPVALTAEEAALLVATNELRRANGLRPVEPDARLVAIARARSRDMLKRRYLDHVSPEGRSVFMVMRDQRLAFGAAGENLARKRLPAALAPREVLAGWANSPSQRMNLLGEAYARVGIGAVRGDDGDVVVTQLLTD